MYLVKVVFFSIFNYFYYILFGIYLQENFKNEKRYRFFFQVHMHNFKIFVNITNMDLKEFLKNLTKYNKNYNFTIINNKSDVPPIINEIEPDISTNINENLDFLKSKYNTLISPDVKIREFNMFALNKKYDCFIIYIDGLVDSISINNFVLEPLMSEKHRFQP